MGNDYHTPNTLVIDVMTEEAIADLILGLTQETEVRAAQDRQHRQTHQQGQKP